MREIVPFRPLPSAAVALCLVLGSCAQITESLQEASDRIAGLMSEDAAPGSGAGPASAVRAEDETVARTGGQSAGTGNQSLRDTRHREALDARAWGADAEAVKAFRAAAKMGHPAAAYELGLALLNGLGVEADRGQGMKWMTTAAARGEARAQYFMGKAYTNGEDVTQNDVKAVALLSDAAAQGHAEAQYALGEAYSTGRGVPKNAPWAARWYGKAAHQGLREAQYAYGLVHARGLGLPVDRTEGYRWLLLAARGGHERAEVVRHALQTKMAPELIAQAETWAERFRPRLELTFADPPTVMYVQQVLNDLGYDAGPVDGQAGRRTRAAVGTYQKKSGKPRDGRISPPLIDRLLAEQAKAP